jgi:membrane-associated phospholipid phosphatase
MHIVQRALLRLEPHGSIVLVFSVVWLALCARFGVRMNYRDGTIVLPLVFLLALVLATAVTQRAFVKRARQLVTDWLPFIAADFVYENLRRFTAVLRQRPIDPYLERADRTLFRGTSPTLWMSRVQTPILTDWFTFAYNLYFILPLGIVALLYLRARRRDFVELTSALVLVFYAGFILYVIFPAGPPRFYAPFQPYFEPLHSFLFDHTQSQWDALNPVKVYASFPSLHCAIATVTLCYATRFSDLLRDRRVLPAVVAPLVVSLWIATVYLRHHWVVDVFAGQALGLCAFLASRAIRRRFDAWAVMPATCSRADAREVALHRSSRAASL